MQGTGFSLLWHLLLRGMALGHTGFSSVVPGLWSPGTWVSGPTARRVFPAQGLNLRLFTMEPPGKPKVRLLLRPLLLAYREPPSCCGLPQPLLDVCLGGEGES